MTNPYTSRKKYHLDSILDIKKLPQDPNILFEQWLDQASLSQVEANAMSLSTADPNTLQPSSRIVLLKQHQHNSFIFFSNFQSQKAQQIEQNPLASLLFWWPDINKQIRIEGFISKISNQQSNIYFSKRPFPAQISAHISAQSHKISSYQSLLKSYQEFIEQTNDPSLLKRPSNWGGYALHAEYFEFWQGGEHRLHQRICYETNKKNKMKENKHEDATGNNDSWVIYEVAP